MGLNSVIVIANDYLHDIVEQIIKDPKSFTDALSQRINAPSQPADDIFAGRFKVISVAHNDFTNIVLIGGNTGRSIGGFGGTPVDEKVAIEQAIRALADRYGYEVKKKKK